MFGLGWTELLLIGVIRTLVNAIDAKDAYTCGHSDRVARIAMRLAAELGLDHQSCLQVYMTGLLHDIGKIGVPDAILCKPGKLTDEEFAIVKRHPAIGYQILKHLEQLSYVLPGVLHHHEAVTGTGYPLGLAGESIPLAARILAVQPEGVAPIAEAYETGRLPSCQGETFADSINVPVPRNWRKAVNAVRETDGRFITVSDDSIRRAMRVTGATAGIFAEPAAAAAVAGIAEAVQQGIIDAGANVAAFITGTGLKDLRGAMSAVASGPIELPPNLELVKRHLQDRTAVAPAT